MLHILFFLFGLCFGSFGNVLIYRVPRGLSIGGRSLCPWCSHQLGVLDLIPILSFLWLRGACRTCKQPISIRYLLVELMGGALFLAASFAEPGLTEAIIAGFSLWLLFLIAIIDAETGFIPDSFSWGLIILGIVKMILLQSEVFSEIFSQFSILNSQFLILHSQFLLAPLLGAGFFGVLWLISWGKWIGTGDILLGAGIGFFLGEFGTVVVALFAAYIIGALIAAVLLLSKKKTMESSIAFGPFLVTGTFIAYVFGQQILQRVFL